MISKSNLHVMSRSDILVISIFALLFTTSTVCAADQLNGPLYPIAPIGQKATPKTYIGACGENGCIPTERQYCDDSGRCVCYKDPQCSTKDSNVKQRPARDYGTGCVAITYFPTNAQLRTDFKVENNCGAPVDIAGGVAKNGVLQNLPGTWRCVSPADHTKGGYFYINGTGTWTYKVVRVTGCNEMPLSAANISKKSP